MIPDLDIFEQTFRRYSFTLSSAGFDGGGSWLFSTLPPWQHQSSLRGYFHSTLTNICLDDIASKYQMTHLEVRWPKKSVNSNCTNESLKREKRMSEPCQFNRKELQIIKDSIRFMMVSLERGSLHQETKLVL